MSQTIRKILSYLFDLTLEKRESRMSGTVTVSLHHGQYKLSTQNAIYSFGKNYTSFSKAFEAIGIQQEKIEKVLVLGFGLGSVVDLLERNSSIQKITAVEMDEVIIHLAKKYLRSSLKDKVEFICADAEKFVRTSHQQFDLVLFDVFIDDETPMPFMQQDFLIQLKKWIGKNGILLFSKIEVSNKHIIENVKFEKAFAAVFPHAFSIDTDGNKVFVWMNK